MVFTHFSPYDLLSVCIHVIQVNKVKLKKRTVDFKTAFHAINAGQENLLKLMRWSHKQGFREMLSKNRL